MTLDLDALEALERAATPEDWLVTETTDGTFIVRHGLNILFYLGRKEDAAFIVAARNAMPELLAEVRGLRTYPLECATCNVLRGEVIRRSNRESGLTAERDALRADNKEKQRLLSEAFDDAVQREAANAALRAERDEAWKQAHAWREKALALSEKHEVGRGALVDEEAGR